MRNKLLSILIFSCLCFALPLQAQESDISDMTPDDYAHLELPSLDVLFENAKNNPAIKIQDVNKEEEVNLLKKEKRSWLKYFYIGGAYNYGILGSLSTYSDSATPLYSQYSKNAQNSYHIGGGISIPIESLFDYKPNINRQKLRIKEIDLQKEKNMDDLKQQIIELYTSIISNINTLKIKAEYLAFTNAQYQIGENDFLNGKGDASSLSKQKEMQANAGSDYETTRAALNMSLLKLEILARTPILSKVKIK
nr:TolC family protein [uncultured Bacteroides sp.]